MSLGGIIRALNSPGSGMSDAHRPVYWLRGSTRHVRLPRKNFPSGCDPNSGRVDMRSPLTVAGTATALGKPLTVFPIKPLSRHRRNVGNRRTPASCDNDRQSRQKSNCLSYQGPDVLTRHCERSGPAARCARNDEEDGSKHATLGIALPKSTGAGST